MFGLLRFRKTCGGKAGEDWKTWRLHYCGTCKSMGHTYGQASRMLLNHDTVYLAEVLTALSPAPVQWQAPLRSFHCFTLPREASEIPAALRYAAAATVLLAEYKLRDQVQDAEPRSWRRCLWSSARRFWSPKFRRAWAQLSQFEFDVDSLDRALSKQLEVERTPKSDPSQPTSTAVAMFFEHGATLMCRPELRTGLASFGAALGSLAYWLDAFEDQRKDATTGQFNAIAAQGWSRAQAIARIDGLAAEAVDAMRSVDPAIAATFASRLRMNLDPIFGRTLRVASCCSPAKKLSRWQQWSAAWERAERLAEGRAWPVLAAVAVSVFVFPAHSRAADSADECLSLSGNLMAVGSLFAVAIGGRKKGKAAATAAVAAAGGTGAASSGGCCSGSCCLGDLCTGPECCCEGIDCCCDLGDCCECAGCCDC